MPSAELAHLEDPENLSELAISLKCLVVAYATRADITSRPSG